MQTQYPQRVLSQRIAETVRNAKRLENLDHNGYSAIFVMSGFIMPVAVYHLILSHKLLKLKLLLFRCNICLSKKALPVSHVTVQHVIKEALSELPNTVDKLVKDNLFTLLPAVNTQSRVSTEKLERKLEIRIQNLPEPTDNTQLKRMESDENLVSDVLKHLNEWDRHNVSSVKRLRQFKSTNTRPRSVLVKFSNEWTASKVLKKAQLLKEFRTPVFVSKSLTSDELALEKLILKKRWELINSGIPKQDLKVRNLQLFHKDIVLDITA